LDGDTVIGGGVDWLTVPPRGGLVVEQAEAVVEVTPAGAEGLWLGVAVDVTVDVTAGVVVVTFFFGFARSWFRPR